MRSESDIQKYMAKGIRKIAREAIFATSRNPRESQFIRGFAKSSARANKRRLKEEKEGLHVPPFLIASITSSCNLHCAGCYSRSNHATTDHRPVCQLTGDEWKSIFHQANDLGVSFILLAGGEPMLRRDVVEAAGDMPDILFPIFTNGTFLDNRYCDLLDAHRNLIPVMSIEGGRDVTDARRGAGIYDRLIKNMDRLRDRGLVFGASVTVTTENLRQAYSWDFLNTLAERGCKVVFFVEYVSVTDESRELAPGDGERALMREAVLRLRREHREMLYLSFPGDEKGTGGCVAAGRGFFHINSHGGAEPCPFSAYSDVNVRDTSLKEAIGSRLFAALRDDRLLEEDHAGGCVLFERRSEVEQLMARLSGAEDRIEKAEQGGI